MKKKFVPFFQSQFLAAFSILIVLEGLYITDQLIAFFVPVRYAIFLFLLTKILLFFISILKGTSLSKNQVYSVSFHIILLSYGLFLSSLNGGVSLFSPRDYLFSLFAVFLTLAAMQEINLNDQYNKSLARDIVKVEYQGKYINFYTFFIILFITSPVLLYFLDIIVISPVPQMIFETTRDGYLQETSKFFGFGSILFWYSAISRKSLLSSTFFILVSIVMLFLSALAGARGEFAICFLILILISVSFLNRKRNLLIVLSSLIISGFLAYFLSEKLGDLLAIKRLGELGADNLGFRDQLLFQSIRLLGDRTDCALIGCGFNYFQVYFGSSAGWYPHNIFAELAITFGIPVGGLLILLICSGVSFGLLGLTKRTPLFWIFLYLLGINLKSGSLIGLTSIPVIIYFAYLGVLAISRLFSPVKLLRN